MRIVDSHTGGEPTRAVVASGPALGPLVPLAPAESDADVVVVGAGIVGIAVAFELRRAGREVLLLERSAVAAGASRGNAGALAYSDILPLASPGIVRQAPRWLLDPLGPLSIRPAHLARVAPWLWRFWRASRPGAVASSVQALAALMGLAATAMNALLVEAGLLHHVREDGNLHLYDEPDAWRASLPGWDLRARHGIAFEHLQGRDAVAALQPGLAPQFVAATFVPRWQTVRDPLALAAALAVAFAARGGRLRAAEVQRIAPAAGAVELGLADGRMLRARQVVLCAGPWSHRLAATLGERIPLEAEGGYNTTLPAGAFPLRRQLTFMGHGFVVTPIGDGVRIGGAVEFAGVDAPPRWARADALLAKACRFLPGLRTEGGVRWRGFRPSLPDSLPVIGPSRADARIVHAFGHGHSGLTQAAATALLVRQLVQREPTAIDLAPFAATRFASAR